MRQCPTSFATAYICWVQFRETVEGLLSFHFQLTFCPPVMSQRSAMSTALFVAFTLLALSATTSGAPGIIRDGPSLCRNLPGDPLFPTDAQWVAYNKTIGGRLLAVVPSAEFCHGLPGGDCTEEMWTSTDFRTTVPGAMVNVRFFMFDFVDYFDRNCANSITGSRYVLMRLYHGRRRKFRTTSQDYLSIPPSLCLQNGTTCGQGNVPVFGVNATEASHIQVQSLQSSLPKKLFELHFRPG